MSEALATLFEGKEIRVLEKSGEIWFPICDLSKALGIDPSTIFKQIERHPGDFDGCVSDVDNLSTGELRCVNEPGLYAVLAISSIKSVKNPVAKEAVRKFRANAPKMMQQFRKKEIVQVPATSSIISELKQTREEADACGCDPMLLLAAVYRKHGETEKAEALQPAPSAIIHGETGWFIPTQLGEMCGLTAEQFNHWLHNNPNDPERRPFQCRDPENRKVWRLTELGFLHGQEYWFEAPSGHREVRIRWRLSILYASGLKREIPASQLMLPTRA